MLVGFRRGGLQADEEGTMAKVMVATPAYGEVLYTPDVESLIKLIRSMHQNKWDCSFRSISYSEISESRNYLLTSWFDKTDASHILFLDADMGFKPQLISEMVAVDQPVVGVISPKRNIDLCHVAKHAADGVPVDLAIARAQQFVFCPSRGESDRNSRDGFFGGRSMWGGNSTQSAVVHRHHASTHAGHQRHHRLEDKPSRQGARPAHPSFRHPARRRLPLVGRLFILSPLEASLQGRNLGEHRARNRPCRTAEIQGSLCRHLAGSTRANGHRTTGHFRSVALKYPEKAK
jgi:hypothetical protein